VSGDQPFYRLAPFIQEYIYAHRWTELRPVQVEACRVIFETNAHLLLASGTASGKTEAAFLPILTLLHEDAPATVGVLYIGPLKALINDQFYRLSDLLREVDIPVWHWHGDVSQSEKQHLLRRPSGVLQITPESLESLLINRSTQLASLFADLRFVVIDEVHAFMASDRGGQVQCQLQRLERFVRSQPRRVGLSATLGDYSLAESWLSAGTERPVVTPQADCGPRSVRLSLEHFYLTRETDSPRRMPADSRANTADRFESPENQSPEFHEYIFEQSRGRKCLIFANSRSDVESVIADLRDLASRRRDADVYHVHHGSISGPLRETAERAMKEDLSPTVIAATVTLELGIDVGQLERIIQLDAPFSVSSFVQRLGRSGRRGESAEMWFVCSETSSEGKELLPARFPWSLLESIAIIQLYVEERWIEPAASPKYPFSLLYHQTMSMLAGMGELSPPALAQRVLTLASFRHVTQDQYRLFLRHLIEIDHIEQTEEGGLIVGLEGEQIVRNFRFYAVFRDNDEFTVYDESCEIGSIVSPPPPGDRFALAGRVWEVLEADLKRRRVFARQVRGKLRASWLGGGGEVHSRVLERMRHVLAEDTEYPYLQQGALERLRAARLLARQCGILRSSLVPVSDSAWCVFPWMGSIAFRTFLRACQRALGFKIGLSVSPYFVIVHTDSGKIGHPLGAIRSLLEARLEEDRLLDPEEAPQLAKYDEFVPSPLLRQAFAADHVSVHEMRQALRTWFSDTPVDGRAAPVKR